MDQDKPEVCESVERVSHSTNTKTCLDEEESSSITEKIDAASNDTFQISASSPKARSKEAAEEEIPQINSGTDTSEEKSCSGTKVKSPVETSNVAPENETAIAVKVPSTEALMPIPHESECVEAEAKPLAGVPNPLKMEEIGKVMSDIFPPFAPMFTPHEEKTCLGARPKTSVSQRQAPFQRHDMSEGNLKSPESYQKFIRSRSKPLKRLIYEMGNLKYFMEDVKMETSGPESLDSDKEGSKRWCRILENWQNVQKYLDRARQMIRRLLDHTVEKVETTDMQICIDILSSLRMHLEELAGLCRGAYNQYKSNRGLFPSCEFMLRIDLFPDIAMDVLYRVNVEKLILENFHVYDSDSESTD